MAGSARSAAAKHAYRMFTPSRSAADEFDESDVWGSLGATGVVDSGPAELARASGRKKPLDLATGAGAVRGSLPMSIPDWQKTLGVDYRDRHGSEWEVDGDDDDYGSRSGSVIPPHELACRSRAASLSVHEGIGRTLKGRDLNRVRDAVWKLTGFEA